MSFCHCVDAPREPTHTKILAVLLNQEAALLRELGRVRGASSGHTHPPPLPHPSSGQHSVGAHSVEQKVRKSCASALRQIMAKLEQKSVDGTQQGFMVG